MLRNNKSNQNKAELRSYQKALEISEKRFTDIAEASGAFVWEIDSNFNFIYLTPNITDILGYSPDSLIGKSFFSISKNESAEKLVSLFSKRANNKEPFSEIEMQACCPSDNLIWLRILAMITTI